MDAKTPADLLDVGLADAKRWGSVAGWLVEKVLEVLVGFDLNHPQQLIEQEFVAVGRLLVFHPPQHKPQSLWELLCLNLVNLLNEKVV